MTTELAPIKRGTTFARTSTLTVGYTGDDFTGGVKFTLRTEIPPSTTVDDDDAIAQATDGSEDGITFSGTGTEGDPCIVTIRFPASETKLWPLRKLVWDLQGTIGADVFELGSGTLQVLGNVTRS